MLAYECIDADSEEFACPPLPKQASVLFLNGGGTRPVCPFVNRSLRVLHHVKSAREQHMDNRNAKPVLDTESIRRPFLPYRFSVPATLSIFGGDLHFMLLKC